MSTKVKPERVKNPSKNEHGLTFKQESFAQLVASGRTQADAYRAAYPGSQAWKPGVVDVQASTMAANSKVAVRIKTLRAIITQLAIEAAVADKAWILKRLKTVAERCLQSAPVLDRKGLPVVIKVPEEGQEGAVAVAFTFDPAGANRALQLLGMEQSMFIERKEIGEPGAFDSLDDEELQRRIELTAAAIARAKRPGADDRAPETGSGVTGEKSKV